MYIGNVVKITVISAVFWNFIGMFILPSRPQIRIKSLTSFLRCSFSTNSRRELVFTVLQSGKEDPASISSLNVGVIFGKMKVLVLIFSGSVLSATSCALQEIEESRLARFLTVKFISWLSILLLLISLIFCECDGLKWVSFVQIGLFWLENNLGFSPGSTILNT